MAQSAFIQKMSHRHEILLDFMLANPAARLKDLSLHFSMTVPWLSTIIHSDAFQAKLAERQDECFTGTVLSLREKMCGLADQAVEKLSDDLGNSQDPRYTLDVADKVLHRLGYAPSRQSSAPAAANVHNTQININTADKETLAQARELMFAREAVLPPPEQAELESPSNEQEGIN